MDASHLMLLPHELLEEVVLQMLPPGHLERATVIALARVRAVNITLQGIISRLKERPHHSATIQERYGVTKWEHVAIAVALKAAEIADDGGIRVGFKFASMELDDDDLDNRNDNPVSQVSQVPGSRARIAVFGEILRRHPRATARVEAHTGPTCPNQVAFHYSTERAEMVARELAEGHLISRGRLTAVGHGKRLSASRAVLMHSTHPNAGSARSGYGWAEIFISIDGIELPARPDFYDAASHGEPPDTPLQGALRVRVGRLDPGLAALFGALARANENDANADEDISPTAPEHGTSSTRRCVIS